jgi:hypothetical protein
MTRLLPLILMLAFGIGCSDVNQTAANLEEATQFYDPTQQDLFKEAMKNAGISFRTDEKGMVWYPVSERERVSKLEWQIIRNDIPAERSVHYSQEFSADLFKSELKRNGISFEAKVRRNDEWIVWGEEDTPRVKKIMDFVHEKTLAHFKQKIEQQRKNASN